MQIIIEVDDDDILEKYDKPEEIIEVDTELRKQVMFDLKLLIEDDFSITSIREFTL